MSKINEPYVKNVIKKYFNPTGELKYTIANYKKPSLNPDKWDTEVLNFFTTALRWNL